MSEIDKMARELLAAECSMRPGFTVTRRTAERAIRAALLTAPPGYVLVPAELAGRLQASLVAFVSNKGWGIDDIDAAIDLGALLAAAPEGGVIDRQANVRSSSAQSSEAANIAKAVRS